MTSEPAVYLDNNATTALAPEALEAMLPYLSGLYANPSSAYGPAAAAKAGVAEARAAVAALLGCSPAEIVFTSGATESNHAAILGALSAASDKRHLITSQVEHPSVLLMCRHLERLGMEVSYLPVDGEGRLDPAALLSAIRPDTALISLLWANNETGAIFPIPELAAIARSRGILFHTDATQALGKMPVDLGQVPVDLLSCSAHKIHGPKGVGALYVRKGLTLPPLFHGHQERGRRGGTENVPAIVGFGAAARLHEGLDQEMRRLAALRDRLERGILAFMPCAQIHAQDTARLPNTSNIGFTTLDGEELAYRLEQNGILASQGAACAAGRQQPSHVLGAMGFPAAHILGSLRFSLGRYSSAEDVDRLLRILPAILLDMMGMPAADSRSTVSCTR